jgi:hypothetical protein
MAPGNQAFANNRQRQLQRPRPVAHHRPEQQDTLIQGNTDLDALVEFELRVTGPTQPTSADFVL